MARRVYLLPKSVLNAINKPQNPISVPLSFNLCTDSADNQAHQPQIEGPTENHNPTNIHDQQRHEQVRKLRVLLQQGRSETARRLIKSLILPGSPFSSPTELYTLACSESKMPNEAVELYSLMRKSGTRPCLASVNVMLESLVTSKHFGKTLELFSEIFELGQGIRPDKFTYGKAIQASVKLGDLERAGQLVCFVYNVLLGGLCKEKKTMDAQKVFDEMIEGKVTPNLVTYNTMIDGYSKAGELEKAFELRERMKDENVEANMVTYNTMLSGFCRAKRMEDAKRILEEMDSHSFAPDGFTYSILFDGHFRCGDGEGSLALFEEAISKGVRINVILVAFWIFPNLETYNILINGYGQMCAFDKCFQIVEEMENKGIKPNIVSYGSLVNGLCKDGRLLEAEIVLRDMLSRGVLPNAQIYNMLIGGCCTSGYSPNVISYNSLISGYSDAGNTQKCLELFETIKSLGMKPTLYTYHPLITEKLYSEMLQMGLVPDRVVYNALIHGYMVNQNVYVDRMTYNSLILGHFKQGQISEVKDLVNDMKAQGLTPKADTYTYLLRDTVTEGLQWCLLLHGFLLTVSACNELAYGLQEEVRLQMTVNGMDDRNSSGDVFSVAKT
ncbi:pentatricopeptide repeat-containing protein [Pyrus ussuriensis x Pyrus communis]|uniref:Pentatricopeptide repeat-containing protein n=1 Tax=Pyrus ussuriensis x Pyrus communis TaxID=2448454 RepID=A0A5N5GAK4_9ROSA|nr:pentatricopeptide repeat-containing protein [Pyrus ussuriensis x Pyrus communis]